jgi:glycerol-3-phosphate dehydrogenase
MVRFAARFEYATTVEDVLARRSRWLFLDAALAADVAFRVGAILGQETEISPQTDAFLALAQKYLHVPT